MPPYVVRVSTCSLNQWALDFEGNYARVSASIARAKASGSRFRTGPELELTGYGCEDHFYESDTQFHAWGSLSRLIQDGSSDGFLIDVGMPVLHGGVRYNARVFCLDRRIVLVRPKMSLAEDGNYREGRWFSPWRESRGLESVQLPPELRGVLAGGQACAPMGVALLRLGDAVLGAETCEELFTPHPPHIRAALAGVDIVCNGSGSHHQLRKLHTRVDLMRNASLTCGITYLYANQRGCDGGRLYYDGCAMIMACGELLVQGAQFGLKDCEVLTASVDLEPGRSALAAQPSAGRQGSEEPPMPFIALPDYFLKQPLSSSHHSSHCHAAPPPSRPIRVHYWSPEEEIGRGPACWLWDFLRRSGARGFFLPLSGGADSAATATIVGVMANMVMEALRGEEEGWGGGSSSSSSSGAETRTVLEDVRRITGDSEFTPRTPRELVARIFHTSYMGTSQNSSHATRARAAALAAQLGAQHTSPSIDALVSAFLWVLAFFITGGRMPRFSASGGCTVEDLALQNLQARIRMVLAYFLAQLLPWLGGGKGFLLVLGSANVDESLRGYMTKYDCACVC